MTKFGFAAIGTLGLLMAGAASAESLTVTHHFPESHTTWTSAGKPLVECLQANWKGELDVSIYPSAQLHAAKNALEALDDGLTQLTPVAMGYVSSAMPLNGIPMLPGLATTSVELTAALRKNIADGGPLSDEYTAHGARPLLFSITPAYQMLSKGAPVASVDAFKGKIWRSGGGTMSVAIEALGGSPAEMPGGDMYVALQRGALDGAILSTVSVKPYKVQEVTDYMTRNAAFGQYSTVYVMSQKFYDGLSDENKAVVDSCSTQTEAASAVASDAINDELLAEYASAGVEIVDLSPEAVADYGKILSTVSDDYVARLDEKGLPGRATFDQLLAALKK